MLLPRFACIMRFAAISVFFGGLAISCWGQDVPSAPTPQTSAAAEMQRVLTGHLPLAGVKGRAVLWGFIGALAALQVYANFGPPPSTPRDLR